MITKLFLMAFTTTLEIINPDNEPFAQVWNLSFFCFEIEPLLHSGSKDKAHFFHDIEKASSLF